MKTLQVANLKTSKQFIICRRLDGDMAFVGFKGHVRPRAQAKRIQKRLKRAGVDCFLSATTIHVAA